MSSYISAITLQDNTVAPESSEESAFNDYAEGASRLFDMLCEVEEGFFDKAPAEASARTFYGSGIDMMRLPPYVGSIAVEIDGEEFTDWRVANDYLYRIDDDIFDRVEEIVVTARWGFVDVPKDVQTIVNELAAHLWRNKDPMFTKISNVETERELSPTINAAIKKYRDKYSQSAY